MGQSNQCYVLEAQLVSYLYSLKAPQRKSKKNVTFLRCSGAFRGDFDYYEMISIFHLCQLHILGAKGGQEKYETIRFSAWLERGPKTSQLPFLRVLVGLTVPAEEWARH